MLKRFCLTVSSFVILKMTNITAEWRKHSSPCCGTPKEHLLFIFTGILNSRVAQSLSEYGPTHLEVFGRSNESAVCKMAGYSKLQLLLRYGEVVPLFQLPLWYDAVHKNGCLYTAVAFCSPTTWVVPFRSSRVDCFLLSVHRWLMGPNLLRRSWCHGRLGETKRRVVAALHGVMDLLIEQQPPGWWLILWGNGCRRLILQPTPHSKPLYI